jgi:UrcA family protein
MNTTNAFLRVLLPTLAAAYLGLGAPISRAADVSSDNAPKAKVVQYGDLNLASPTGVERLYQRIVAAAHDVCDRHGDRSLGNFARTQICVRQSIARAVATADRPELTALYTLKTGQQIKGTTALAQR